MMRRTNNRSRIRLRKSYEKYGGGLMSLSRRTKRKAPKITIIQGRKFHSTTKRPSITIRSLKSPRIILRSRKRLTLKKPKRAYHFRPYHNNKKA